MASKTCAGCKEPRPDFYFPRRGKLCEDCAPTFDGDTAGPVDAAKVKTPRAPGTLVGVVLETTAKRERAAERKRTRKPRTKREAAQRDAERAAELAKMLRPRRSSKGGRA